MQIGIELVLADDLTGAAEVAAARNGCAVTLLSSSADALPSHRPAVVDLDTRSGTATEAYTSTLLAVRLAREERFALKTDSMLRGYLVHEFAAVLAAGKTVVFAPSLPEQERSLREGILYIGNVPLSDTDLWKREDRAAPEHIRDVLGNLPVTYCGWRALRTGALPELIRASRGGVVVCDALDNEDLSLVADAALDDPAVVPAGSAGLLKFLWGKPSSPTDDKQSSAQSADETGGQEGRSPSGGPHPALIVVGSASSVAADQINYLSEYRPDITTHSVAIPAVDLLAAEPGNWVEIAERISGCLAEANTIITITGKVSRDRLTGRRIITQLAEIVRMVGERNPGADLVALGGETARAMLESLGVDQFLVVGQADYGAVVGKTLGTKPSRTIITRPGSFGERDSLACIADYLTTLHRIEDKEEQMTKKPYIAVTMGDGAGVGPECCVAAVINEEIQGLCVPIVIGDKRRLEQAAAILGVDADVVGIDGVNDAVQESGRINVIDLGLLPEDLPWGEVSAAAGDAAFHYIEVAAVLAQKHEVQAICTAPLNKAALHKAGHNYPGHTELLASLTNTPEVSMMLATPKLRVVHVTTHIGLIDAIAKIEPGLVERTTRRGWEALKKSGIENPRIGVCAINPHAGEGGLFGYGEEEEKIAPAIRKLQGEGMDVAGPLPADTAFYLGGRGDYDLIVAMYHDQGHGPIKVLGIEEGVNITIGLPVVRTSVDHGTAFDIAGTGTVGTASMIEAMRQAVAMADRSGLD